MNAKDNTESQANQKQTEELFHDLWASSVDPRSVLVEDAMTAATCPEHRWLVSQLGEIRGQRVLDLGCGCGEAAVWFAKQGADVVACDLSSEFLALVNRVAALHAVRLETKQSDAETLPFKDEEFDIVYAGNLLHHVNMEVTLVEIKRVLKPGGRLISWDPLRHNPVIDVYRRMAQPVRTPDEHPLSIHDTKTFARHFSEVKYKTFWLFALWIFVRFWLIERVHPAQDRYWKRIIREHRRLTSLYERLARIDERALRVCPYLQRHCWNIAIVARK